MLIDLGDLICKYQLKIRGVLHVGAHECEELEIYQAQGIDPNKICWVEAQEDLVKKMKGKYPGMAIFQAVIANEDNVERNFIVTNNYQSSSLLELKEHLVEHPQIYEIRRDKILTTKLSTLIKKENIPINQYNFLNIDIQGTELDCLKSMDIFIGYIDYIYSEVNTKELYKGGTLIHELDNFLSQKGFTRLETSMTKHGWGDALYIRKQIIPVTEPKMCVFDTIKNKQVVFDVGTHENIDFLQKNTGNFHLFEPNPEIYQKLRKKTEAFSNCTVNNFGLGAKNRFCPYYDDSLSFVYRKCYGKKSERNLPVKTLDSYCEDKKINSIDFLNIDTEGSELDVLLGGTNILHSTSCVQFVYGGTYQDRGICLSDVLYFLYKHGFLFVYIVSKDCLLPTESFTDHYQYCHYVVSKHSLTNSHNNSLCFGLE